MNGSKKNTNVTITSSKRNFLILMSFLFISSNSTFSSHSLAAGIFGLDSNFAPNFPTATKEADPWRRFRSATTAVQKTQEIQAFLKSNPANKLNAVQNIFGNDLETTKFQHYYRGLEVVGSTAFYHQGSYGSVVSNKLKKFDLDTTPEFSTEEAAAIAHSVAGDRELRKLPDLKILPSNAQDSAKLVYWIELNETELDGARKIIIDAHSGRVIGNLPQNIELAPIEIFSAKNLGISVIPFTDSTGKKIRGCDVINLTSGDVREVDFSTCKQAGKKQCQVVMDGAPVMINPRYCAQAFIPIDSFNPTQEILIEPDSTTARAFKNADKVLSYYLKTHNRNSYDNEGSPLVSVVHAGLGYSNAHWDIIHNRMVYGDGDGKVLGDFTLALDVTGHEMTHGITSVTAELINMGEPGALNEAYSDFFGKMIDDSGDWAIGKNLFLKTKEQPKGIRDLAEPHHIISHVTKKPYPNKMSEKMPNEETCNELNDYCYVHLNATIPGHAGYLVVQAIGKYRAEKLYYTVLTQALGANDTFQDAADETRKICGQMYDLLTCSQVDKAFVEVGL